MPHYGCMAGQSGHLDPERANIMSDNVKAEVTANVRCVEEYVSASGALSADREKRARALVQKYAVALTKRGMSIPILRASIKEAHDALKAQGMRDPLGWRPSWAAYVPTVNILMNVEGSSLMPLDALFALAADLEAHDDMDGKRLGAQGARELAQTFATSKSIEGDRTVQALRAEVKPKARKVPARKARPDAGAGVVDVALALRTAIDLVVDAAAAGVIREALANAIDDALAALSEIADSATVN